MTTYILYGPNTWITNRKIICTLAVKGAVRFSLMILIVPYNNRIQG